MNKELELPDGSIEAAADNWFNQWVEEMVEDFDQVELDEFILMD